MQDLLRDGASYSILFHGTEFRIIARIGQAEAIIVVAVVGIVVVAIGNTAVGGVVVPAAPAQHTVLTFIDRRPLLNPFFSQLKGVK